MERELITLVESDFSRLKGDDIHICKIGGEVDPMWGMNCILLSKEQINALLDGDCVWLTDGEYATVLRAEQAEEAIDGEQS